MLAFSRILNNQQKGKDLGVESLRGLAILLVVAFHIIGHSPSSGIQVSEDSFWRYFTDTLEFIRLPLFVAISGFVYALKPVNKSEGTGFLLGKARRILIPFLMVSTLQYVANTYAPATNNELLIANIWRIYLFPWAQFWYLQAIALVFMLIFLLEQTSILKSFTSWLGTLAITFTLLMIFDRNHYSGIFSIWGALYIFPFFILGLGIQRFQDILFRKSVLRVAGFIMIVGFLLQQLDWFRILDTGLERKSLITLVTSLSGIVVLFRFRRNIPILSRLGYYSYSIYLFHVFGGAGSRIILQWIGIENKGILFAGAMLMAILVAVIIERIVLPYSWPRFLILGMRLHKSAPESSVSSPFRRDKPLYPESVQPKRSKSA